ncbi:MAG: VOC family protein [Ilumatobacteraceae bacterium]
MTPHLWFDKEAKEAAEFYASLFANSKVTNVTTITDTPSGDCDLVSFHLRGHEFRAISAGPYFKINPSISFIVSYDASQNKDAKDNIDSVWEKLVQGGTVLMALDKYPFSERYGWVQDKFGLSWQLITTNPEMGERSDILSSLMFVGDNSGKAEEAINFYRSVFKDSKSGALFHYGEGDKPNSVMFADFKLLDLGFAAMDSPGEHQFNFNEAISFMVNCDTQKEIDYYWDALSAVPESEQCGWLKDKYGVSWQIIPSIMEEVMASGDQKKVARLTQAFLKMKKFDLDKILEAAEEK